MKQLFTFCMILLCGYLSAQNAIYGIENIPNPVFGSKDPGTTSLGKIDFENNTYSKKAEFTNLTDIQAYSPSTYNKTNNCIYTRGLDKNDYFKLFKIDLVNNSSTILNLNIEGFINSIEANSVSNKLFVMFDRFDHFFIAEINQTNGQMLDSMHLDIDIAIEGTPSCYNETTNEFINLVSIDNYITLYFANTQSKQTKILPTPESPKKYATLEMDNKNNTLYAIIDSNYIYSLVSINQNDGSYTVIKQLDEIYEISTVHSTYNENTNEINIIGYNKEGYMRVFGIDVINGNVSETEVSGREFSIIEVADKTLSAKNIEQEQINMTVSPNPTSDVCTITYKPISGSVYQIELRSILGNLINSYTLENNTFNLNTNGLKQGNYILNLIKDNQIIESKKLIVQ